MKTSKTIALSVSTLVLVAIGLINIAKAETIEERCRRNWKDNGGYRTCIANETAKEAKPLDKRACFAQACYYRLSCTADAYQTCTGASWQVVFSEGDPGTDIAVRDPDGKTTKIRPVRNDRHRVRIRAAEKGQASLFKPRSHSRSAKIAAGLRWC